MCDALVSLDKIALVPVHFDSDVKFKHDHAGLTFSFFLSFPFPSGIEINFAYEKQAWMAHSVAHGLIFDIREIV